MCYYSKTSTSEHVQVRRSDFCFDYNSEMKGHRELSDVLNWREICFEDFENQSELINIFSWKSITKNTNNYFCKIQWKSSCWHFSYRFSRKHFYELGQVSKCSKQISLQFKTSLSSLRPSISDLWSKRNEQKRNDATLWS
jgi:hypothetical protein